MARTITQIENDIDNAGLIKFKEYIKDYVIKLINKNTADIDGELQKIFTEVQGLDAIVSVIPKPIAPAATDPATANDGDLFFNTTDLFLKYYHTGTWHNLAHLGAVVDLTGYYTKVDADAKFETKANITTELAKKADKSDTYTKAEVDAKAPVDDTSWKTSKQDTLTKTMTLTFDDGTTEDVKVG